MRFYLPNRALSSVSSRWKSSTQSQFLVQSWWYSYDTTVLWRTGCCVPLHMVENQAWRNAVPGSPLHPGVVQA